MTQNNYLLQNQYGPQFDNTRPPVSPLEGNWLSTKSVSRDFGLATNVSLGQEITDRTELATPKTLGKSNPMASVGAVERYQKGQVRALPEISLEAGGESSQ
ncbi:MAG: hypothetical protein LBE31_12190 [Deltaproteobacteria bacterium]|nr:hypothetical protein [Deltaproteobacteria bacterium]